MGNSLAVLIIRKIYHYCETVCSEISKSKDASTVKFIEFVILSNVFGLFQIKSIILGGRMLISPR